MNEIENDSQLWDHLQRLFGVGTWDEGDDAPFWLYRSREAAKIKTRRTRMSVSIADLALAATYCKAHGIDIRNATWLYHYINDARAWDARRQRALAHREADDLIASAVAAETAGDPTSPWIDRLVRARGPHRQEVYDAWCASSPHANPPDDRPASSASTVTPASGTPSARSTAS